MWLWVFLEVAVACSCARMGRPEWPNARLVEVDEPGQRMVFERLTPGGVESFSESVPIATRSSCSYSAREPLGFWWVPSGDAFGYCNGPRGVPMDWPALVRTAAADLPPVSFTTAEHAVLTGDAEAIRAMPGEPYRERADLLFGALHHCDAEVLAPLQPRVGTTAVSTPPPCPSTAWPAMLAVADRRMLQAWLSWARRDEAHDFARQIVAASPDVVLASRGERGPYWWALTAGDLAFVRILETSGHPPGRRALHATALSRIPEVRAWFLAHPVPPDTATWLLARIDGPAEVVAHLRARAKPERTWFDWLP
jgi:hypothetical protein